jgi:hypothetical protein
MSFRVAMTALVTLSLSSLTFQKNKRNTPASQPGNSSPGNPEIIQCAGLSILVFTGASGRYLRGVSL